MFTNSIQLLFLISAVRKKNQWHSFHKYKQCHSETEFLGSQELNQTADYSTADLTMKDFPNITTNLLYELIVSFNQRFRVLIVKHRWYYLLLLFSVCRLGLRLNSFITQYYQMNGYSNMWIFTKIECACWNIVSPSRSPIL